LAWHEGQKYLPRQETANGISCRQSGIFAADASETVAQVAAVQESIDHLADDRSPMAVLFGEAFLVKTLELIEVVFY
jgi:hypothetical protein